MNTVGGSRWISLTGFTSKANRTCCMSGDTWYLVALALSWMGVTGGIKTLDRDITAKDNRTHEELLGHDGPGLFCFHVEPDDIPVS